MKKVDIFFLVFLQIQFATCFIDPFTIGAVSAIGYVSYKLFSYDRCIENECCDKKWVPVDTSALKSDLVHHLHGQPIAADTVYSVIRGYKFNNYNKALTLSFHGLPGSGKNFVADMIANAFFKKGKNSMYYNFFNGRSYAPDKNKLPYYKNILREKIATSLFLCPESMFVFDEVDMMPEGLLDVVVPFIDHTRLTGVTLDGRHEYVVTNKAIYIFLSNTGSKEIMEQMLSFWQQGKDRNEMKLADFENLIETGAFNEKGGFKSSDTISTSLIDHYVPFMPLEEKHVRLCMRDSFKYRATPTESMEQEVLSSLTWGPEPYNIYSKSGCKKIEQKVVSVAYRNRRD